MRRVHSTRKECRLIAGRARRLWYMKYGYLQTQHLNRCQYVGEYWRHRYKPFRAPHPARRGISSWEWVGFSRRRGNPKVWSGSYQASEEVPLKAEAGSGRLTVPPATAIICLKAIP